MNPTGVLLINLGTPDDPSPQAVGRFLREFLMDPLVLDMPAVLRWPLVNIAIVPRRKKQSALLYQKIQSAEGSPLLFHTRRLANEVAAKLAGEEDSYLLRFAMRYGNPSIATTLAELHAANVEPIFVLPLYPQYAESSFETAVIETEQRERALGCAGKLIFLPPFYAEPAFLDACAQRVEEFLQHASPEQIIFSFHSLPVRHIKKLDRSQQHCLVKPDCCDAISSVNQNCYRAQSVFTARAIADRLGLHSSQYTISFQSRLGRAEWLGPQTEDVLRDLAGRGVKDIAVCCPSFVCDCLETLEEIAIRGRAAFVAAGGSNLQLVPSLNSEPAWVEAIAGWIVNAANRSGTNLPN